MSGPDRTKARAKHNIATAKTSFKGIPALETVPSMHIAQLETTQLNHRLPTPHSRRRQCFLFLLMIPLPILASACSLNAHQHPSAPLATHAHVISFISYFGVAAAQLIFSQGQGRHPKARMQD